MLFIPVAFCDHNPFIITECSNFKAQQAAVLQGVATQLDLHVGIKPAIG
jgi:hypothetical protein